MSFTINTKISSLCIIPLTALMLSGCGMPRTVNVVSTSTPIQGENQMVATANPYASEAAIEVLRDGGSAVDAAIAAQMVLTLVEPQSSGIGGGAFMMYYDAKSGDIAAYDGREKAPASATPDLFMNDDGSSMGFFDAVVGGRSVGVPGVVRMMELAHKEHGKLPWARLFQPAIDLSLKGFPVSERMNYLSAQDEHLKTFKNTAAYFFNEDGSPHPLGTIIKNPKLANSLTQIAEGGADAFYKGPLAKAIVDTVQNAQRNPTELTMSDMVNYTAIKREAVCQPYRQYMVCGMPPPSSGGITTLQILGILQNFDMGSLKPGSVEAVHLISEASNLAFADRNMYLADDDFVPAPPGLLDPRYLASRAALISTTKTMGKAEPGMPGFSFTKLAPDDVEKGLSTTHFSIIDKDGGAVSMTSSIETQFGSRLMAGGFLLNNQLTDFSFEPEKNGAPVANQVEANKRPRSSMSPTLVFDQNGEVVLAIGSPGGSSIIGYVTLSIIGVLDWGLNVQQAIDLPHYLNKNGATRLEQGTKIVDLKPALENMGHEIDVWPMVSGLQGIAINESKLFGGVDPRREGSVSID